MDKYDKINHLTIGYLLAKGEEAQILEDENIALGHFIGSGKLAELISHKYESPECIVKDIFETLNSEETRSETKSSPAGQRINKNIFLSEVVDKISSEDLPEQTKKILENLRKALFEGLHITIEDIRYGICDYFRLSPEAIQNPTRIREILRVRQHIMFFCKIMGAGSLKEIGKKIGNKNHATVVHAKNTINNLLETKDGITTKEVQDIITLLKKRRLFSIDRIQDKDIRELILEIIKDMPKT